MGLRVVLNAVRGAFSFQHTCGYEYTNNLHRMFTDMSLSGDLNKSFNDALMNAEHKLEISATFLILQVCRQYFIVFFLVTILFLCAFIEVYF